MRLFRVLFEYDDPKAKGERMREERWYAAPTVEAVWDAIAIDRVDSAMELIAIIQHAPAVQVLAEGGE